MSALHEAEAIAELGRKRVLGAQAYRDAWASLARSCVPVHTIRHLLDRKRADTEAMKHVDAWGGRGPLLMLGERGRGKSHAAAEWLRKLHLEGRPGHWLTMASWLRLSFDGQREQLELAAEAHALVIDDLGAGGSTESDWARKQINGLLLERFGMGVPTLLCANGELTELNAWLDGRVTDRLKESGDIVVARGPNMRKPDTDSGLGAPGCPCGGRKACGHGTHWRLATELVELLGCEHMPRAAGRWEGDLWIADGPTVTSLRVGCSLIDAASERDNLRARELLGLKRDEVLDLADTKRAADKRPQLRTQFEEAYLRMVGSMGSASPAARKSRERELTKRELEREDLARSQAEHRIRSRMLSMGEDEDTARAYVELETERDELAASARREDNLARSKAAYAALRRPARSDPGERMSYGESNAASESLPTWHGPPAWTQADDGRAKMRALGVRVEGQPGHVTVRIGTSIKAIALPSVERGWEFIAELLGSGA